MKKIFFSLVFSMAFLWNVPVFSQIENEAVALGLPGDNLNLYAVLDVFQKSRTLEEFERAINSKEGNINNLDLNNDNLIDYIRVVSYRDGDSYSIVLRVAINRLEDQDVAVIEVNKNRFGKIVVQIIGDEELYGSNYIVEPTSENTFGTLNPGYVGNERVIRHTYWNDVYYANDWPVIIYLFSPSFSIYVSPWRWNYYPYYWRPWTPVFYYNYWGYHRQYYHNPFYRRTGFIRYAPTHSYYRDRRSSSPIVRRNRLDDSYRRTYEGRNFRRPETPVLPRTRQQLPGSRSVNPAMPGNRRPLPGSRQGNEPTTRPAQPTGPRNRQPVSGNRQQYAPGSHQPMRGTRQENAPVTRPVQPATPRYRQPMSGDRQQMPSGARSAPEQRNAPSRAREGR